MITKLGKTLRRVRAAFSELELRWYVFGARAAIAYGVVRATDDIDVTVDPAEHSAAAIARALASQGFVLELADPAFVAQTRVLPVRDATGVAVDVVLGRRRLTGCGRDIHLVLPAPGIAQLTRRARRHRRAHAPADGDSTAPSGDQGADTGPPF